MMAKSYPPTSGRQWLPFIPRLFKPLSVNHLLPENQDALPILVCANQNQAA